MFLVALSLLSATIYLTPVAVVVMIRRSKGGTGADYAVDVPLAVAVDLLAILLLAHLVRLDAAIWASRALWFGAGVAWFAIHRAPSAAPPAPGMARRRLFAALGMSAGAGLLLSLWRSRTFAVWDRQWHIPLVASLRGQELPFMNVYQPAVELGYHVSGDVLGGVLQALSFGTLHSSLALSLAHDIVFGLTGLTLALFLLGRAAPSKRTMIALPVAIVVFLLSGPFSFGHGLSFPRMMGFTYLNYYQMSFRPHVVLAGLLIVGILGLCLTRLFEPNTARRGKDLASIAAMLALLAVTDEPSAALVLLGLGMFLLLAPEVLGVRRWPPRILAGGLLLAAAVLANIVFPSIFGNPGVSSSPYLSFPHAPSLHAPALPLSQLRGWRAFLADNVTLIPLMILSAVVAVRSGQRALRIAAIAFGAMLVASFVLLTCVVVVHSPGESHRFMTLPMLSTPLLALFLLFRSPNAAGWSRPLQAGVIAALAVSAACTYGEQLVAGAGLFHPFRPDRYAVGIHDASCRASTGARLFEPARPVYVPLSVWYAWTGCHPSMAPGRVAQGNPALDVGRPITHKAALAVLGSRFVKAGEPLAIACPKKPADQDVVCRALAPRFTSGSCRDSGTSFVLCELDPRQRDQLISSL